VIDFLLRLAVHGKRYGFGEFESGPGVQRYELLPVELKHHGHHAALRSGSRFPIAGDLHDFRVLENRDVKIHRFFSLLIEPQEGCDFLHGKMSFALYLRA